MIDPGPVGHYSAVSGVLGFPSASLYGLPYDAFYFLFLRAPLPLRAPLGLHVLVALRLAGSLLCEALGLFHGTRFLLRHAFSPSPSLLLLLRAFYPADLMANPSNRRTGALAIGPRSPLSFFALLVWNISNTRCHSEKGES